MPHNHNEHYEHEKSRNHHSHPHNHSHGGDGNIGNANNIGMAFFLNLSFTVIELIGGILTNSIAIMSDAIHDFGDCLSLALAWFFQRKSRKGSTKEYTYGYKRYSLLGALVTSTVLVAGSVIILTEAIPRLFSPQDTHAAGMMGLAVLGIIVHTIAVLRTRKASSINERVVSLHMLEDALGWAAVLIGSIIMYFTGLTIIDPILSIAIACFVLFNVVKNIRQVLPILLQGSPAGIESGHIADMLRGFGEIDDIHDLHIWAMDEENNILTAHVRLRQSLPMESLAALKERIRAALKDECITHATIEFESPEEPCDYENCAMNVR